MNNPLLGNSYIRGLVWYLSFRYYGACQLLLKVFFLCIWPGFCSLMHVLDYILNKISSIYRFNNYPLYEKAYSIMLYVAGLSFRDISERCYVTMASWGEC